jgi:hypothetical protein
MGSGAAQHGREGLSAVGQLVYQKDVHYASLRGALIADPFGTDADGMVDMGLLYGRVHSGRVGHAAIAAGLSLVSFQSCDASSSDGCLRIGVPVIAEAAFRPIPIIGLGAQAFLNLNREAVAGGAVIFMQVGWVR